jgi:quinoprotein glucose dehydrogenase
MPGATVCELMMTWFLRALLPATTLVFGLAVFLAAQSPPRNVEWRHYGADLATSKYSPLDHIHRGNVKDLQIVWRWKANNFGPQPDFNYQATPLMIDGVLYTTAGSRRDVVAIDAVTGETLWMFRYDEGRRGQMAPARAASGRGVSYWTDGKGNERILYVTLGYRSSSWPSVTGINQENSWP